MVVATAPEGEVGAPWGDQMAREFLRKAGFQEPVSYPVEGDVMNTYYVAGL